MIFEDKIKAWKDRTIRFNSSNEREIRRTICRECEHFVDFIAGEWCGKCHCNMMIKTSVMEASCPLNPPKWNKF